MSMQENYSRDELRMLAERILKRFPGESGAARLQQAGLFLLIYVMQSEKEPVTVARLKEMTGQGSGGLHKQLDKLSEIGLIEKTQIRNKQGRGRAFLLTIKDTPKTRRITKALEQPRAKRKR
jgi:predicted transcriptional regulator